MSPGSFELCNGRRLQYELFLPSNYDPRVPIPFLVSVPGGGQTYVNGFSRHLPSDNWAVVVPLRSQSAPLFFEGKGARGDGVWHLHELCQHLLKKYRVGGSQFLMVGVSNGGNSVLRFATLWPKLCCGLVVVTGSLQGLVSLPEGLRALQGIPVDMHVGTRDECGFYEPMVALAEHFKTVGHEPAPWLKIFRGAGHCCSPLVDHYLLHGKILLMLLRAGTAGSQVNLGIPKETRRTAGDVLSALGAVSDVLGLQWSSDGKSGLKVWASGAVQSFIGPPTPSAPGLGAPRIADFAKGDALEAWSNSRQSWVPATVVKVLTGTDEAVTVIFESDDGGVLSKTVPIARASDYLRRPSKGAAPPSGGAHREGAGRRAGSARPAHRPRQPHASPPPARAPAAPEGAAPPGGGAHREGAGHRAGSARLAHRQHTPPARAPTAPEYTPEAQLKARRASAPALPEAQLKARLAAAPPDARLFVPGERVAVWSKSGQSWIEDGEVSAVAPDAVTVVYSAGALSKVVPLESAARLLRRAEPIGAGGAGACTGGLPELTVLA